MSATVDASSLKDFFNFKQSKSEENETAAILSVVGKLHPIAIHYANGNHWKNFFLLKISKKS